MAKSAETKNPPLPMTVVCGYLGAGKTTLINRLLSEPQGQKITVLVNDFGSISLDEKLIENQHGDIIALANGCMCCQIGGDLYRTIDLILQKRDMIDLLIVETSGVADPAKIANIAIAEPDLDLRHVLTLIDVLNFSELFQMPSLADTLERQIKGASLIALTKTDIANEETVERTRQQISKISPSTRNARNIDAIMAELLSGSSCPIQVEKADVTPSLKPHNVPFESWSWQGSKQINKDDLLALLQQPKLGIFRFKGKLRFDDGKCGTINKVGGRIEDTDCDPFLDESTITAIGTASTFCRIEFAKAWNAMIAKVESR